ncbi:MAG: hypothetical protein U0869_24550 [Chloroflexota bacterium]
MTDRTSSPILPAAPRHAARRRLAGLVAALLALALLVPVPAALGAIYQVTFYATIGSCAVSGTGPANTTFKVTLKSASGATKAAQDTTAGAGFGAWSIPCLANVAPGDVLIATKFGVTLRKFTVPAVNPRLDRVANTASGKAPKSTWVTVTAYRCELDGSCNQAKQVMAKASSTGTWSKSVAATGFDPRGGDRIDVDWGETSNMDPDTVGYTDQANRIEATVGSAVVRGYGDPGATVTVSFTTASGAVRGTGKGKANASTGRFSVTVKSKSGAQVKLASTNKVVGSVASNAKLTVASTLGIDLSDAANDHVQGHCFAGQPYALTVDYHATPVTTYGTAAPTTGLVDKTNASGQTPMQPGVDVTLLCQTPAGDRLTFVQTVP